MKSIWTDIDRQIQKQTPEEPRPERNPSLRRALLVIAFLIMLALIPDFLGASFWDVWAESI